jgi:hypothetical protein
MVGMRDPIITDIYSNVSLKEEVGIAFIKFFIIGLPLNDFLLECLNIVNFFHFNLNSNFSLN